MARIVVGSYVVRFPLGGYLSWVLQWLVGFQRLGHEVYFVEKSGWPKSCYDPSRDLMSDDCSYGIAAVNALLGRFGLHQAWCFVDANGRYHGLPRERIEAIFRSADLFVDLGGHGTSDPWLAEATETGLRVAVDGEPGFTQMEMETCLAAGEALPAYDRYYTVGMNVGTKNSSVPTAGKQWGHVFDPVNVSLFAAHPPRREAPFTTVMSWHPYDPVEFNGVRYGLKDVEFLKFINLPSLVDVSLELAISGKTVPVERLNQAGWRLRDPLEVTASFDSFTAYVASSRGEFSVGKNIFVATNSGCFSERSAVYLASGRPVVMQDTGFSSHLPCGRGLFAVRTVEEGAAAIDAINRDYERHSKWARDIACEHLEATRVLEQFLSELGIS